MSEDFNQLGSSQILGSLEKMLSSHSQSMFEYLAPRRGGGGAQPAAAAAAAAQAQAAAQGPKANEGYKDMVY